VKIGLLAGAAAVAITGLALAVAARPRGAMPRPAPRQGSVPRLPRAAGETANARRLDQAAALLAASALADSAVEHYRGSFHNKSMYAPLGISALTIVMRSLSSGSSQRIGLREITGKLAIAGGVIGTGFHFYNIGKRPGGFSWLNLFYAAPLGAPAALTLAGLLGDAADRLRRGDGRLSGVGLARLVSGSLLGTAAEAALLHFRGAYHNPAMVIPVAAGPLAAGLLAQASFSPQVPPLAARWSLRLLTAIGFVGAALHAYGVQRNMGGWRNWSQNLLNGPPLPAPPAFTALAMAGLAALRLIEEQNP
jgi:hypothetical protein